MELTDWEKDVLKDFYDKIMDMQNIGASMNEVEAMLNEDWNGDVDPLVLGCMWRILSNPQVNVTWPIDQRTLDLKEKLENITSGETSEN